MSTDLVPKTKGTSRREITETGALFMALCLETVAEYEGNYGSMRGLEELKQIINAIEYDLLEGRFDLASYYMALGGLQILAKLAEATFCSEQALLVHGTVCDIRGALLGYETDNALLCEDSMSLLKTTVEEIREAEHWSEDDLRHLCEIRKEAHRKRKEDIEERKDDDAFFFWLDRSAAAKARHPNNTTDPIIQL